VAETVCKWALYKGLWHTECHCFLTTTDVGDLNYTFWEIPLNGACPNCERQVLTIDMQFGRKQRGEG
jgi:hypothetical protein